MKRILLFFFYFLPFLLFSQISVPGCMDSTALNFNPNATTDDGSCTFCYASADFGTDSIQTCDSVLISVQPSASNYSWITSNPIVIGSVQQLLNQGLHPFELYKNGISLDSLLNKNYAGGVIFYLDTINGNGMVRAPSLSSQGFQPNGSWADCDADELRRRALPRRFAARRGGPEHGERRARLPCDIAQLGPVHLDACAVH